MKFLGAGTTYGTVLGEAAAVASDASQLGISSSIALEDYSGEFTIEVLDDGVQVAVLSDDGVSVQVTDLGDIDDPSGPEPVSLPGLAHFGEGQDLPKLDQSLKLIPGTLTANHRYRYQWQYRNTFQTGPADINGMKVFVFGGAAQLALAPAKKIALFSPQTPPTKDEAGNNVIGTTWTLFEYPNQNALATPGSVFTLGLGIREVDSLWLVDGNKTTVQPFHFELDADGKTGIVVTLKLKNATFDDNSDTATIELVNVAQGELELMPKPRIHVSPALAVGDFVELTISSMTDPGRLPESVKDKLKNQGYEIAPNSTVTDPPTGERTCRWMRSPEGLLLPTAVEGVEQVNLPEDDHVEPFTEQEGRYILLTYGYLPDRNGENNPAGNYDGVMVREYYDDWAIEIEGKSFDLVSQIVKDTYRKPGDSVDAVFSKWIEDNFDKDATFTIQSNPMPISPTSRRTTTNWGLPRMH